METSKHTVTIPIADYNELLEKSKGTPNGLTFIKPDSEQGIVIKSAYDHYFSRTQIDNKKVDVFEKIDFYFAMK